MTGWRAAAPAAGVLALAGCGTTSGEDVPAGSGGPIFPSVPSGTSRPPGTTPAAPETSFTRALTPAGPLDAAPGPLAASTSGTRYQMLLRAADLAAAGPIRALAFAAANDLLDAFECRDVEVRTGPCDGAPERTLAIQEGGLTT